MNSWIGYKLAAIGIAVVGGYGLLQTQEVAKKPLPTGARYAYEWRRLGWLDENGKIEPGSYARAMAQRNETLEASVSEGIEQDATGLSWNFRGPINIGGRTRSLLIDPANPNVMLAGAVSGGIWRTTNGGDSWSPINDWLPSLAIGCLAQTPQNANVLYAGLGEGYFNGDAVEGSGILKSTDRGLTWSLLPATAGFGNTNRISVSPTNSNIILAGTRYNGIQRSTDGGATWTTPRWAQGSYYVQFHPTDGNKAIATIIDYSGGWFHAPLYSTDAGATWTQATGLGPIFDFSGRIELSYAPSNPSIVYAVAGTGGGVVYKSTNGGQSYTLQTTSGTTGTDWYRAPIWVDPTNPNVIVAGSYHVSRSTDGGQTISEISEGYIDTTDPHPDIHLIVNHPQFNGTTNKTVYICTDGGVYKTNDIYSANKGTGWSRLDFQYQTAQYYGASGHGPTGRIVGGTQDNGHHTFNTGNLYASVTYGGDGGFAAISPTDPQIGYGEYVYLTIHRSTNGGLSASDIYNGITDAWSQANFIAPFILDPNQSTRMLAGGANLWRSNNVTVATPTWSKIANSVGSNISAIAVGQGNSSLIYYGTNDGRIYKSVNGTATTPNWAPIDNNGVLNPLPNRFVARIVIDPNNLGVVYATFGGWTSGNAYKSTNGGSTWTSIQGTGSSKLPDAPIRGFAVHPTNSNRLYAGTEVGLFTSADGGQTWGTSNFGPAQVAIYEVNFMSASQTLLVATHGRGVWTANATNPSGRVTGNIALGADYVGPKAGLVFQMDFRTPGTLTSLMTKQAVLDSSGNFSVDPDLPNGTYDIVVKAANKFMRAKRASVVLSSTGAVGQNFSPLNGDCDGNNVITSDDYLILSNSFDKSMGDAGYDARADLNGDNSITTDDYLILSNNFDLNGAD